jgi:predicted AlkP superfamily phosphohydrolase/phosphomutase
MRYRIRNRGRYRTFVPIPTYRCNWDSIWNKVSDPNPYKWLSMCAHGFGSRRRRGSIGSCLSKPNASRLTLYYKKVRNLFYFLKTKGNKVLFLKERNPDLDRIRIQKILDLEPL